MEYYSEQTIQLAGAGRQDCADLHSWGPGMRTCYVIHYILRGQGTLETNGKIYPVKAGQSFLITPLAMAKYYPDPEDPWEYAWIDFTGAKAAEHLAGDGWQASNPVCPFISQEQILPLYQRIMSLDWLGKNRSQAGGLMLALLGVYADQFPTPAKDSTDIIRRLDTALTLIHANYYHHDFHVNSLCSMMHLSRVTLYRLFQTNLHMSPMAYLQTYRLEQAKKMLSMDSSVKSTSVSCGFADPLYFSKLFKEHTGISPSRYKTEISLTEPPALPGSPG